MPLCTPRSCLFACRGVRGYTPRSSFSPCRGGRGCSPRTHISACREGTLCTLCSSVSACRGVKVRKPRRSISGCHGGNLFFKGIAILPSLTIGSLVTAPPRATKSAASEETQGKTRSFFVGRDDYWTRQSETACITLSGAVSRTA